MSGDEWDECTYEEQHHPDCLFDGTVHSACICTRLYSAAKREREGILGRVEGLRAENPVRDTLYRRDVINAIEVPF